jgi:CBS domain-containing protein
MSTRKSETLRVADVMLPMGRFPVAPPSLFLKEALEEMGRWRLGIVCIVGEDGTLAGILTDGDIRRKLLKIQKPFSAFFADDVIDHAVSSPTTVSAEANLVDAVRLMEKKQIWDLPVVDGSGKLVGLLHLHPVVQVLLGLEN